MGGLSPRANGLEHLEAPDLVVGDCTEPIPNHSLDATQLLLGQAQRPAEQPARKCEVIFYALDAGTSSGVDVVREQISAFDELIARASGARDFLEHALACTADHPVEECPHLIEVLDKRLGGVTLEELAAEQGQPVASAS